MVELWSNTRAGGTASCGDCHTPGGPGVGLFARSDNVNDAYAESNPRVNRDQPGDSQLVTKLLTPGGHNCWLASDQACADIMTNWIEAWVGDGAGEGGRQIQLNAPPLNEPAQSKAWPDPVPAEFAGVHDLLTEYCSDCHASDGATMQQSPFFAEADRHSSLMRQCNRKLTWMIRMIRDWSCAWPKSSITAGTLAARTAPWPWKTQSLHWPHRFS